MIDKIESKLTSKIFNKYGVFFAFNDAQLERGHNRELGGIVSLGGGMFAPSIFACVVIDKMEKVHMQSIDRVQSKYSNKQIIWDELSNHEAQITGNIDEVVEILKDYKGITRKTVQEQYQGYFDYCCENDLF